MIPDWRGAIRQAITYLAPNGELHAVDFGQCEELPALFRRGLFAWLHHFNVSPRQDLGSELGAQAALNNLEFAVRPLYRGYAWSAVISKRQGTISGSPSTSD
jgi:S-adenosylmethionine-diacylgycerolhomoserine-N-methlytransferase